MPKKSLTLTAPQLKAVVDTIISKRKEAREIQREEYQKSDEAIQRATEIIKKVTEARNVLDSIGIEDIGRVHIATPFGGIGKGEVFSVEDITERLAIEKYHSVNYKNTEDYNSVKNEVILAMMNMITIDELETRFGIQI